MNYIIAIIIIFIFIEIFGELHSFTVKDYDIFIPGKFFQDENLKNKLKVEKNAEKKEELGRVAFLSDLHLHIYGYQNSKLSDAVRKQKPDYILIGGDMLIGKSSVSYYSLYPLMRELVKIAPVYYANGNHEQRLKEYPDKFNISYAEYKEKLEDMGIVFLENASVQLSEIFSGMKLLGLEMPIESYTRFKKMPYEKSVIDERIGRADEKYYNVLLAHNPMYMDNYLEWGADLVLGGHYHGGIGRIPGITGLISPAFQLFPEYSGGLYHKNGKDMVVSKGLGTHTINLRLFNVPEVVMLHFYAG